MSQNGLSTRVLNWGLLSTARINRSLIPPLRASKRNRLVAVASRSRERAQGYARIMDIPKAYGHYEELVADPEIDVIYNSLPNHLHAEWTIKAAQAGKSVLCEKPLALSVEEVDAMTAAARENGVIVAEAFMYMYHAQTNTIREMITRGELGALVFLSGSFTYFNERPDNIRWNPEWGGGSLWDVGCYPVSYSMMVMQKPPLEVQAWQVDGPSGVDVHFAGQLRFPGGVVSQFTSSFGLPYLTEMEIRGTQASLYIPSPYNPNRKEKPVLVKDGHETKLNMPDMNSYEGEIEDMADAILDGKPQAVPLEQSRLHIAVLTALLESARTGKVIAL